MIITDGQFFTALMKNDEFSKIHAGDLDVLRECMSSTVNGLLEIGTSTQKPGMLLGMIQSGKTKAFLGIAGLAFDNGLDIAIVLTKGTTPLSEQTRERLERAFDGLVRLDCLQIHDVMKLPRKLSRWELNQRLVIVCKKNKDNFKRLQRDFFERYPQLKQRRVLIVDDEADYASIGFKRNELDEVEQATIARQIDSLRRELEHSSFLQVTATPYSLYLQPNENEPGWVFEPQRPAFSVLLPAMQGYVGGKYYFRDSADEKSCASYLFSPLTERELEILKQPDRRALKIEDVLTSKSIPGLRRAIVNFIVGACIRHLQQDDAKEPRARFSFIIHTQRGRESHTWQEQVVTALTDDLVAGVREKNAVVDRLIGESYDDLERSIALCAVPAPPVERVRDEVKKALSAGALMVAVVNSDQDVANQLDDKGELKLRTPMNIFVGGQILDRGVTIRNLIGFYYGRRANRFQQDAVLQHSRMYGFRPQSDLAVTRFYTTPEIYQAMRNIHEFDTALREAFESGAHCKGIVFIRKDESNNIVPCSPNKILLSTLTTLRPFRRLLPIGFRTRQKLIVREKVKEIDTMISRLAGGEQRPAPFLIQLEAARRIVDLVGDCFDYEDGYAWNKDAFIACMEYLARHSPQELNMVGQVHCLVRRERKAKRFTSTGDFYDAPDTGQREGDIAREVALTNPMLMLFRQKGLREDDWDDCEFWWPVLYAPRDTQPVVFASDLFRPTPTESKSKEST